MAQTRVAKLTTTGDLKIAGGLNERQPAVLSGLVAHYPLDGVLTKYIPGQIRYIRDWINGSTTNAYNHWVEIQAIDYLGNNVALSKTVTASSAGSNLSLITDGDLTPNNYGSIGGGGLQYVSIDLGDLYCISKIRVYHYNGDTRTYHNTKTEVSDDGIHWYSIFDSAIEGEYSESPNGHTIDFMNLGTTCRPMSNIGNTLNYDGVSIEETTTNLIPRVQDIYFKAGHGWYNGNFDVAEILDVYNPITNSIGAFHLSKKTSGTAYQGLDITLPNPTLVHTVTMYVSMISGNINSLNCGGTYYYTDNSYDDYTWITTGREITKLDDNLYKVKYTFTPPVTGKTFAHHNVRISNLSGINDFLVYGIQVEQKPFSTSITSGTRAEGDLKFKGVLSPHKGTILVELTIHEDNTINNLQGNDQYVFGNTIGNTLANTMWFHDTDWWFFRDDSGTSYGVYTNPQLIREQRTRLALVYDDTDGTMDVYINGKLATSGAKQPGFIGKLGSLGTDWTHSGHATITSYKMCQTLHSLTFYNIPLTAAQIASAHQNKMMPNKIGDLVASKVTEKAVGIPTDVYYFPLALNGKDVNGVISPSVESDTIYTNDGVWIGKNAPNIAPQTGGSWSNSGTAGIYSADDNTVKRLFPSKPNFSLNMTGSGESALQVSVTPTTAGTIYSGHIYAWLDCPTENNGSPVYLRENTGAGGSRNLAALKYNGIEISASDLSYLPQKRWIKFTFDNIVASGDTTAFSFCAYLRTAGNKMYLTAPKIISSRACDVPEDYLGNDQVSLGKLRYNFNRDIGLDWSSNWSICYWKKAVGTHLSDLSGWNIESLGCGANSLGTGYIYWGKAISSDSLYNAGTSLNPPDYFGKWYMVSIVKNGGNIIIKHWYPAENKVVITETRAITISSANYFLTQYDYDFVLGGFYSSSIEWACNTFFRDLIVAKRIITDAELTVLATTFTKTGGLKTRIQGKLTDGYVNY